MLIEMMQVKNDRQTASLQMDGCLNTNIFISLILDRRFFWENFQYISISRMVHTR